MGIARGTNIVRDGLIYGYDTGYGVADKNTSTRFYPGRPTTNEINFATEDLNNWTSYSNGNDGTFTTEFGTVGLKINNRTSWNGAYKGFTLPSTGTYTFSGWFRYRGGTSNNNGAAVYISSYGGSDTSTWLNKSKIGEWQRVSKTVNVTDVTVTFYFISYGGTQSGGSPDKSSWDVTMPQIEKLSDETPFVNGSRSNTTSLIDLKRTTNIDVSNANFDSTGQPDFDGTDDRIVSSTGINLSSYTSLTYEGVVKAVGLASHDRWFSGTAGSTYHNPDLAIGTDGQLGYIFSGSGIGSWNMPSGLTIDGTKFNHLVYTFTNTGVVKIYINGTQQHTATYSNGTFPNGSRFMTGMRFDNNGEGVDGSIPIAKVYSKALTADEVMQNYKAYKNRFNL